MSGSASIGNTGGDWVADDACTLPVAERPLRVGEFDELFRTSLERVGRLSASRIRLVLTGRSGLQTLAADLAARESCCSFFDFAVTGQRVGSSLAGREVVHLEIAVPGGREDVLAALADRAEAVGALAGGGFEARGGSVAGGGLEARGGSVPGGDR
ncbi:MAG: hypothetical protein ACRDO2_00820 [Nocardioidaceae bacterium]